MFVCLVKYLTVLFLFMFLFLVTTQTKFYLLLLTLSILIYKRDTNFCDGFFIIPILLLKNNFHIKIDFQFFLVNNIIFSSY
jgi:hypothetical protein